MIFDQNSEQYAWELIEEGIAERIESAGDIIEKIQNQEAVRYDISYFWKGNALCNLEHELRMQLSHL